MNVVISDTAEYGCYLFTQKAEPLLRTFVENISSEFIGKGLSTTSNEVDNQTLIEVNNEIREHPIEWVGEELRGYMTEMKQISAQ